MSTYILTEVFLDRTHKNVKATILIIVDCIKHSLKECVQTYMYFYCYLMNYTTTDCKIFCGAGLFHVHRINKLIK